MKITNAANRLACYDHISQKCVEESKSISIPMSKWALKTERSPIDDSKNVYLSLEAENAISGWPSFQPMKPKLIFRCKEHQPEAYIITGMASNVEYGHDGATVTIRFDKAEATQYIFNQSTEHQSLFAPEPIEFIYKVIPHNSMLFQFVPFNSPPTITTFKLNGLNKLIDKLGSACKWETKIEYSKGKWVEWYQNGQKAKEEEYKDGKKHGKWLEWYPSGQKKIEEEYHHGKLDGIYIKWNETGQVESKGLFKDNNWQGPIE